MRKYTAIGIYIVIFYLSTSALLHADNNPPFSQISSAQTDWTTKLIGTWQGKIQGQDLELAIWIPKYYDEPGSYARLNLYMQTTDGRCIYGDTHGHPPSVYYFDLPGNKDFYEVIILKYYFMPHVYNETKSGQKYCSEQRDIFPFFIYYDRSSGQITAQSKGYRPGSSRSLQWPLTRVNPSQKMASFLNGLERKYGSSFFGAQRYLLMDKGARYSSYKARIQVPCIVPHRFALTQMYKKGISGIEAFPVSGKNTVEVKMKHIIRDANGSYKNWEEKCKWYPKKLDIDWPHLSMKKPKTTSAVSCKEAAATLSFLPRLSQQTTVASPKAPKLNDINGYYIVNLSGIDQIRKPINTDLGASIRRYGGNTIFSPGDKTRQFRWDTFSQKMVIQNYVKSLVDKKIDIDRVNYWDERKFVYDAVLSGKYKEDIFVSANEKYDMDVCIEWQGQVNRESCIKYVIKGNLKNAIYMTASEKTAIKLFKNLSPQKGTWKGLSGETGQCPGGPFCELQGGDYLNAIYRGDLSKISDIDREAFQGLRSLIKKLTFGDDKFYTFLSAISNGANESLLPLVVDEYMYGYQKWAKDHCLDSGALMVEKKEYVPGYSIKEVYLSGAEIEVSRTEGYMRHSTYIINPEFWPICQRFCGVQDSKMFRSLIDAAVNKENAMIGKLYIGLKLLRDNYDCRSPEIQIFEKNLIDLSRNYESFFSSRKFQLSSW